MDKINNPNIVRPSRGTYKEEGDVSGTIEASVPKRNRMSWVFAFTLFTFCLIFDLIDFILTPIFILTWILLPIKWIIVFFILALNGISLWRGKHTGNFLSMIVCSFVPLVNALPEMTLFALRTYLIVKKEDREYNKRKSEEATDKVKKRQQVEAE